MKLEGSLDAFSLPDIFQLLSFTKKTGGLHLATDGMDGVVFFAAGQVTGASADSSRQPLARRLVGSGAVPDDALLEAVAAVAEGEGIGVVRALLEADAVDAQLLHEAATDQSVDAIFDLLRWASGDFAFVMDEGNPDDVGVSLPIESVLADTEARKATWDSGSQVVPSAKAVPTMPVVLGSDPVVSRDEWALLALVDGRRSVGELVDLTGSGQYAVVSTLAALAQRGLIHVRAEDGSDGADGADEDHVTVVMRRQALLSTLEQFVPVVPPPTAAPEPAHTPAPAAPSAPARPTAASGTAPDKAREKAPVESSGADSVADGARPVTPEPADGVRAGRPQPDLVTATADAPAPVMLGGAHVPEDVVPPRPEPFLPKRQADFDETATSPGVRPASAGLSGAGGSPQFGGGSLGDVVGATATAPDPDSTAIERDPNVNRSLMLRLIAGVRGL